MVKRDNPAGRLHEILTEARTCGNTVTYEVWAQVLKTEPGNKADIIRRVSLLQELLGEVKTKISCIEGLNTDLYLSTFQHLENAINVTNFDVPWDSYKPQLNDAAMLNLAHCAEQLSRYDESQIDENELSELLKSIDELSDKIRSGTISKPLQEIMLDLLETMRRSINEYRIRGAAGMKRELAYSVGVLIQHHAEFKAEETKEEVGMFGKVLSKFNGLVTFALKLKELGFDFDKITGFIGNNL